MGKSKLFVGFLIIGIILIIVNLYLYWIVMAPVYDPELGDPTFDLYTGILTAAWALVTTFACLLVMGVFTFKAPPGKVWGLLGFGFLCWTLGEAIWAYNLYLGEDLFPSIADFFYIIGYPLLIGGLILQQKSTKANLAKSEIFLVILVLIATIGITIWGAFLPIFDLYWNNEYDLISTLIILAYPIMDWLLLPSALILFFKFKGGEFSKSWFIVFIGMILMIIADLVFAIMDAQGIPMASFYYDHLYNIAYFFLALGALHLYSTLKAN